VDVSVAQQVEVAPTEKHALLRRRNRQAPLRIVGLVGTSIYTMVLTDGTAIMGGPSVMIFSIVLWLITIGLYVYARAMARKGVLR